MKETVESKIASWFAMSDEVWQRHSNPWSVWTRVVIVPFFALAVWSRVWIGWWCLIPVAIVIGWTWFNPRVFPKPRSTDNWASKGVLGERVWLNRNKIPVPSLHSIVPKILNGVTTVGLFLLIWGLWGLEPWPTATGMILLLGGKLWFVDRMVWIYHDMQNQDPQYQGWP